MSEWSRVSLLPSQVVTLENSLPVFTKTEITKALGELDFIHRIPKRIHTTVFLNHRRLEQGSYDLTSSHIALSRFAKDPLGTFIHEFGHFLDHRLLHPLRRDFASRLDSDLEPLIDICRRSRPILNIQSVLQFKKRRLSKRELLILRNSCESEELFARAYLQWVCAKSNHPALQATLEWRSSKLSIAGTDLIFQWEQADFMGIMSSMELLFKLKGLL